jgi:ElaB/YqjD/DUF883 family membrane-anchored ribosome-binding protein
MAAFIFHGSADMAEEVIVPKRESEESREGVEETRTSLADKMETLEQGMKDTWEGVTTDVAETVQAMHGAVHDTTAAMGRALDFPAHVRRHPWLMIGGALLLGFVVGNLVGRMHP